MQKQEIRKNREKMRDKIKNCMRGVSTDCSLQNIKFPTTKSPQKRQKIEQTIPKRAPEEIRHFDELQFLNQTHVLQSFQDMFEQLEKVGEGCHSTIYKCREIKTGRIVAAKVFKHAVDRDTISQFKGHFLITRVVYHENIIKAHYLLVDEKLQKVRMICEYYPFKNLRQYMDHHKKISESTIIQVLHGIMSGVAYLHQHGICHRDMKPDNVLYNPKTGELKLIDFQIAKMSKYTDQPLEMWTNTGTLHYKAPQMFKGAYNEQIDIWAVGVIAYELAFRKLPFDREYVNETIADICEKEPDYESGDVLPFLLQFIKGCLTKDPRKRMTYYEALRSPLLLSYDAGSSISPHNKKLPMNMQHHQDYDCDANKENHHESIIKTPLRKSKSSNQLLNHKNIFQKDIGIQFLEC